MTKFITRCFLVILILENASALCDDVTRVFIFAGQSNMEGGDTHADQIDDFPMFKGAGIPQKDVLYSYMIGRRPDSSNGWVPLQPLKTFGPEVTFARKLKEFVSFPIAIIKSAVGGTTIAFDWNPDAPSEGMKLYPKTLKLIQNSFQKLREKGIKYRLEAVMWHQGENDMLNRSINKKYSKGLKNLISRFRKDLDAPHLKWFIGEISSKGIWGMDNRSNLAIIRLQQKKVIEDDPFTWWVPTSHLSFEVMNSGQPHYHFGTQGQLQHGEAYARAYLAATGKKIVEKDRSFNHRLPIPKGRKIRLFILAGQRNMEGEDSYVSEIPQVKGFKQLAKDQGNIIYRYSLGGGVKQSSKWEPLGPVDYLGNFGPELSFGAYLEKSLKDKAAIAIVKFTHSGAQSPDWFPKGSKESYRNLYPKFISFLKKAMEDLSTRGYEYSLEGVFWHTGENDTYFYSYRKNYARWMKQLIDQVRIDLKQPSLPWFISQQHKDAIWKNIEEINGSLSRMAQTDPNITMIKTSQLPNKRVHFGTRGTLMLGEEMAKTYLKTKSLSGSNIKKELPNFVLVFTDDQGYQDVGCFGSPLIKTPNLDRMASEGMKFTDFYVGAPICSASRASLMTGCYCRRVSVTGVFFPNRSRQGLNPSEITIAEVLKNKDYATACIGKWHLGDEKPFLPTRQGFDSYFGIPYSNDMKITLNGKSGPPLMRDEKIIEHPANLSTLTKRYTEEAIKFITKNKGRPFFLYLPHTMPHVPLAASSKFKGKSRRGLYGDVIEEIDWSVGQILKTLKELNLDKKTLVIFTSDNGPWLSKGKNGGCALPLRDGKFTWFDGGMREACIMRWPGKIPMNTTCKEIASTIDILPTFAFLAGTKAPEDRIIDGKNIWPLMSGQQTTIHKAYFLYGKAIRSGKWKLVLPGARTTVKPKPRGKLPLLLFDLSTDISEKNNVAKKYPGVVKKLKGLLLKHNKEVSRNRRPVGQFKPLQKPLGAR